MIPFKQATQGMFSSFLDRSYKLCRYIPDFPEIEMDCLEKVRYSYMQVMRKKMMHPSQLFDIVTSQEERLKAIKSLILKRKLNGNYEEDESIRFLIDQMGMMNQDDQEEYEDDLEGMDFEQPIPSFPFTEQAKNHLNETQLIYPQGSVKLQSKNQKAKQDSSDQQDSYDEYLNMIKETRSLAHSHCKLHISGIYSENTNKMRANKSLQFMTAPLLLVKHRESQHEYVVLNCHNLFKIGEVSDAFEHLQKSAQSKQEKTK